MQGGGNGVPKSERELPVRGKAVECAPGTRDPHLLPADVVTKCRQLNLTLNLLVSNDKREKPNCTFLGGCNERAT
jgi:hypothetical protein